MPGPLTIRPIQVSGGDLKKFVVLPYRLYADDPSFVPPLKGDALKKLVPGKNGWLSHASPARRLHTTPAPRASARGRAWWQGRGSG